MKRMTCYLICIVILLTPVRNCLAEESDELSGYYSGRYEMTEVKVDNINPYLKSIDAGYEYDNVTPQDYYKGTADIRIEKNPQGGYSIKYKEDGEEFEIESFSITTGKLHMELKPGYYGYDEDYLVSGIADLSFSNDKSELDGTFTIYLPNGAVESSGIVNLEKSTGLVDKISDIVNKGDAEAVEVTDVLFKTINVTLEKGHTMKLKATVFPREASNKGLDFVSSAPSVVEVDANGEITAVSGGRAQISVASKENPDIYDVCRVVVFENETDEGDKEREKLGMTIFKDEPEDFIPVPGEVKANIRQIEKIAEMAPDIETVKEIRTEKDNLQKIKLINKDEAVEKYLEDKNIRAGKSSIEYIKESLRVHRKPVSNAVDTLVSTIKPLGGFKEFIKKKADTALMGLDETREKTQEEKREQLYNTFTNDNTHSVFDTIKEKLTNNPVTRAFSWVLDKITAEKTKAFTDSVTNEHDEIVERINKRIENGLGRDEAVDTVRSEFANEVISDEELAEQEQAKTLWQKMKYMFGGSRKGMNGISSKRKYYEDADRFDKHVELMDKNLEFED